METNDIFGKDHNLNYFNKLKAKWLQIQPANKTILKLLPVFLILVAIPLTANLAQQKQSLFQFASPRCDPNIPGLAKNCDTSTPTPIEASPTPVPSITNPTPTAIPTPTPTMFSSNTYYVSTTGNDLNSGSQSSPWKTLQKAANAAPSGATIIISSGIYSPFSITRPNLTFEAASGTTPVISGGTTAIIITNTHDITIKGLKMTGATNQGVWVDTGTSIVFSNCRFESNLGHGIQIIRSSKVEVRDSIADSNKRSGIRELDNTKDGIYIRNTVSNNGHDGQLYNGDGILLQGSGALVSSNTIFNNGDSNIYEHGIYASALASEYTINSNTLTDNAASGIKASGAGIISSNTISGSVRGIVFSDTGAIVTIKSNTISATIYSILVATGTDISRYQSDYNIYHTNWFGNQGSSYNLLGWQKATGLDMHSLAE